MSTRKVAPIKASYHHGSLSAALTQAARDILESEGLAKLSLRAAARRAGVSQAAPYHHFRHKEALLASVAAQGHCEFSAAMCDRMDRAAQEPKPRLIACGVAYVEFATENPALFRLMFGSTIEHCEHYPELVAAGAESYQVLEAAERAVMQHDADDMAQLPLRALGSWCSVHGLATLLIDGGLSLEALPGHTVSTLAEQVLKAHLGPA